MDLTSYLLGKKAGGGGNGGGGITPSGTISITENGDYDVTNYANASVNVVGERNTFQEYLNARRNLAFLFAMYSAHNSSNVQTTVTNDDVSILGVVDTSICRGSTANMFQSCSSLTSVPLFDTSNITSMDYMFSSCSSLTSVPLFNTSKVTNMQRMFYMCRALTSVPLYDTSNVTDMSYMFATCTSLETVPLFDTSKVKTTRAMFATCTSLETVPLFDMSNVLDATDMFHSDSLASKLSVLPHFDFRSATSLSGLVYKRDNLTEIWIKNIKTSLTVSLGTSWGHLLTVDSLIHLIKELRDTGSTKTLTVGDANLEKLANVYVKLIEITDDMRAEDDLIDEKLPFVVCDSTDEGAMLIQDYVSAKNWAIK